MVFFSVVSQYLKDLAIKEAEQFNFENLRIVSGGIEFTTSKYADAYLYCLSSRYSVRILLKLSEDDNVKNIQDLKNVSYSFDFSRYFTADNTFSVTSSIRSSWLNNSMLASQVVKDGICDRQREVYQKRSSIDKENPDFIVHIFIDENKAILYLDFSGPSMSKRHYRVKNTEVYLQEHTAAAVLARASYTGQRNNFSLLDPFCGSGTILIEAALIALDKAPGLIEPYRFFFTKFPFFDEDEYKGILNGLWERFEKTKENIKKIYRDKPFLFGFDIDEEALSAACENARAAGVEEFISFKKIDIRNLVLEDVPSSLSLVVTDPPYNYRVHFDNLDEVYSAFFNKSLEYFQNLDISVLFFQNEFLSYFKLKPNRSNTIMNGSIKCMLYHYHILSFEERKAIDNRKNEQNERLLNAPLTSSQMMIFNRLLKNNHSLSRFLNENDITSYRLYDNDIPEFSAAVDIYDNKYAVIQEYDNKTDSKKNKTDDLYVALIRALNLNPEDIFIKTREKKSGKKQYDAISNKGSEYIIHEGGLKFLVNFTDRIDTGLFLDHRNIRSYIRERSKDARFLNLFSYTGSATVYAVSGGALSSISVDASAKYLSVAKKNLEINRLSRFSDFFVQSDVIEYLYSFSESDIFDLIFLDPPTFSNSKDRKMFDVQKDHARMIKLCMRHLDNGGELIFSNNFRNFKLDESLEKLYFIEDISSRTIDEDFRNKKIHKVYIIRKKQLESRSIKAIAEEIRTK